MAEEALGKTVKLLRTLAKSPFTKLANYLSTGARSMVEDELREEFRKLPLEARRVSEGNDGYRIGLLADIEANIADGYEAVLSKQQEPDLEKTINECQEKNWMKTKSCKPISGLVMVKIN